MTSLWLLIGFVTLGQTVSQSSVHTSAQPPMHQRVHQAVVALEHKKYVRADTFAQHYLQHLPKNAGDDDVATAKLVSAFARLHGGQAEDALSGLDILARDHIDLGPQGLALRAQALAHLDSCQQAFCIAKQLPDDSLWATGVWRDVAACMLHHNPTLPVHHPMPEGVRYVHDALWRHGQASLSPQDAAHALLLAGRLSSAWGDANAAEVEFAFIVDHYGSLTDGTRARSERLALRRSGRIVSAPATAKTSHNNTSQSEALQRTLQSRTERLALLKESRRVRVFAPHSSASYVAATLNLARLAQIDRRYAEAQNLLSALLRSPLTQDTQDAQATANLILGDVAILRGQTTRATANWSKAAASNSPYGTLALLHSAAALQAHGDTAAAALQLRTAQARLPLAQSVLLVRDDGAAILVTPSAALAECARLQQLLAPASGPSASSTATLALAAISGPSSAAQTAPIAAHVPADQATGRMGRPHLDASDLVAIEVLINHHLPVTARSMMRLLPAQDLSPTERLVAAYLYARLGDTFRATLLMQHCDDACRALDPTAESLAYPLPYKADVLAQSHRAHIPAALLYAIMREESGFNTGAKSGRGAAGLMQLMPSTAEQLAHQAHMGVPNRGALLHADVSIALGAQLLGQLYRHFHGNVSAVAAAYQAGQPKAQSWLEQAQGKQQQLSQTIPLASSRIYVQHIEAAFARYQRLLAPNTAPHQHA